MAVQPTSLRSRSITSPRKAKATLALKDRIFDKSPKPSPPKQVDSFRFFSKLPPELRLKIWNLSLPSPRLVSIQCGSSSLSLSETTPSSRTTGCISSAPIPINLHVCAESRREALKIYRPCFGFARGPGQVLFSPDFDIMYFGPREGFMAADSQFHTCMALCDPAELARVRRLAISDALFWIDGTYRSMTAANMTMEVLKQIALRMPGLKELVFVPREEESDEDGQQAVCERMTRQIQTAMHSICQQFPSWRPPPWGIVPLDALPCPAG